MRTEPPGGILPHHSFVVRNEFFLFPPELVYPLIIRFEFFPLLGRNRSFLSLERCPNMSKYVFLLSGTVNGLDPVWSVRAPPASVLASSELKKQSATVQPAAAVVVYLCHRLFQSGVDLFNPFHHHFACHA